MQLKNAILNFNSLANNNDNQSMKLKLSYLYKANNLINCGVKIKKDEHLKLAKGEMKEFFTIVLNKSEELYKKLFALFEHNVSHKTYKKFGKFNDDDIQINYKNKTKGYTALHLASYLGEKEVVEALINKGANLDEKDKFKRTPLYLAVLNRKPNIVTKLLLGGANPNLKCTNDEISPLTYACNEGFLMEAKILIARGADVTEVKDQQSISNMKSVCRELAIEYFIKGNLEKSKKMLEIGVKNINDGNDLNTLVNEKNLNYEQKLELKKITPSQLELN